MLNAERALELARADYAFQESYRESLFGRLKFLLTASTLLIAGNLSLMSNTPAGWRWWVLAVPSACSWVLLLRLFALTWQMYRGHDYKDPKTVGDYLKWRDSRREQLNESGFASGAEISSEEAFDLIVQDYSFAAAENRKVNLDIQAKMVRANRIVLWLTLILVLQGVLFVAIVTIR